MEGLGSSIAVMTVGLDLARHARSVALEGFGAEGVARLAASRVLVVGAGGLGSAVLPQLVSQGVGHLTLYESDRIEPSNLPRQLLYTPDDVGLMKGEVTREKLLSLNPTLHLDLRIERVDGLVLRELDAEWDLLVDCADNYATSAALDIFSETHGIPLLWGGIEEYRGQVALFNGGAGVSFRDVFGEPSTSIPLAEGVFVPLVYTIGSLMVSAATHYLLGMAECLDGELVNFDLRRYEFQRFQIGSVR